MTNKKTFSHNLPPLPDNDYLFPGHSTPVQNPEKDWDMPRMDEQGYLKPSTLPAETINSEALSMNRSDSTTENTTNVRTNDRTTVSPVDNTTSITLDDLINPETRRRTKRDSFEFYIDQLEELDRLDREAINRTGKGINKSEIVRTALDVFLGLNRKQ